MIVQTNQIKEYKGFRYGTTTIGGFVNRDDFVNGYVEIPKDNLLYGMGNLHNEETFSQFSPYVGYSQEHPELHFAWAIGFTTMFDNKKNKSIKYCEKTCRKLIDQITQLSPQKEINDDQEFNYHED